MVELSAADLELLTWRLCQPNFDEIDGYWTRHGLDVTPVEAGRDLYVRLCTAWEDWYLSKEIEE